MHERHAIVVQSVEQALGRRSREWLDRTPGDAVLVVVSEGDRCTVPGDQYIVGHCPTLLDSEQRCVLLGLLLSFPERGAFASIEASRRLVLDHHGAVDRVNEAGRPTSALDVAIQLI